MTPKHRSKLIIIVDGNDACTLWKQVDLDVVDLIVRKHPRRIELLSVLTDWLVWDIIYLLFLLLRWPSTFVWKFEILKFETWTKN